VGEWEALKEERLSRPPETVVGVEMSTIGESSTFIRRGGEIAAVVSGTVRVVVSDRAGAPLFRWTVDVEIADDGRVERGSQTFDRIEGGPEVTATLLRRSAALGEAWVKAVQEQTIGQDDPLFARIALAHHGGVVEAAGVVIDTSAELEAVARWVNESEERLTGEQLRAKLSELRGASVTASVARQRKSEARKRGMIPASDNGTRPSR